MDFRMLEYSIDMVRLSCDVKREDFKEFFKEKVLSVLGK